MITRIFCVLVILLFVSCKKMIDVKATTDIDDATMFSDDNSAIAAATGQYADYMKSAVLFNGQLTKMACLYADDIARPYTNNAVDSPFLANQLRANNMTIKEIWNTAYYYIYSANKVLKNLSASTGITPQTRKQLEGETRFLRALVYFYLVNLFGEIPLVLSTDSEVTRHLGRAPENEIYDQIKSDLLAAVELLSLNYPGKSEPPANRVRANKGAAMALLAKVYLYMKDYPNAIALSSQVIDCGIYKLESNPDNVFLAKSNETIWALYPTSPKYNTVDGRIFITTSARPPYVLTESLLHSFENNDARATKWMRPVTTAIGIVNVPYKYKVYETDQVIEYNVMLRLAEMYLIRAEANASLGHSLQSINDLNVIRARAGVAPLLSNLSVSHLKNAIESENQHEFFAELGHRWFDIRRWPGNNFPTQSVTRADEILRVNKLSDWKSYKLYWPIPGDEILKSSALTQNRGYEN